MTIAVLVISTLVVASTYFLRPNIEDNLKTELKYRFSQVGLGNAVIDVSGRDVILMGDVNNKAEVIKAENTAKKIWGVREVENKLLVNKQSVE